MTRRIAGLAAVVALAASLGGCAAGPAYPLMTPITVAQSFGYDEHPLGANRVEVSYVTPPREVYGSPYSQEPIERQAKLMASDLATLRAAQLAQQGGWQGFDIVDRHSSSDATTIGPYWDPWPAAPDWGWGWGWRRHGWDSAAWYQPPEQRVQAQVRLSVSFTNEIKPGDYRAADIIQRVGARYPGALVPGPGAPPAASPAPPA